MLGVVIDQGPRSREDIAHETGLHKTSVSSLVSELIELGFLRERGIEQRQTPGRPAVIVEVSRAGAVGVGLEIGIESLAVHATDLAGGARYKVMAAVSNRIRRVDAVLEQLAELARDALVEVERQGLAPVGMTVALPGLVDTERGVLLRAPNLGWSDVEVVERLRELIAVPELPLAADNEGTLAALGELYDSRGSGFSDFIYLSGDVGVGAGIVSGGRLLRSARGFGGEFGHMTVEPEGRPCRCGSRGRLETRVGREQLLTTAGLGDGSLPDLVAQAGNGEPRVLAALEECGRWLGIALGTAVNLLAPEAIVLGGHFAALAPWLTPIVEDELRVRVLSAEAGLPTVVASRLGREAAVRGAAAAPVRHVLAAPRSIA